MILTVLGSGAPPANAERFGPATLISQGGTQILIDCGSGVTQRLLAAGSAGSQLTLLLLTHLHSDHVVDLFQLILSSWHQGRSQPWLIKGPPGTNAHIEGLMKFWHSELEGRRKHECRPSSDGLEVIVEEIGSGWSMRAGDLSLMAFEVDHRPVQHALGFKFEHGGKSIVISGDTRPCPELEAAAQGCDVLLHEVLVPDEMPVTEGVRTAETVEKVSSYHTRPDELGSLAQRCNVKALVATHIVPPSADRRKLLEVLATHYSGPCGVAEDLMQLDVTTGIMSYGNAFWRLCSQ